MFLIIQVSLFHCDTHRNIDGISKFTYTQCEIFDLTRLPNGDLSPFNTIQVQSILILVCLKSYLANSLSWISEIIVSRLFPRVSRTLYRVRSLNS
jgi:hypothetical protein